MAGVAHKVKAIKRNTMKAQGRLAHTTKAHNRCSVCGRSHGYIRRFKVCRICFRQLAMEGRLPGVRKASW